MALQCNLLLSNTAEHIVCKQALGEILNTTWYSPSVHLAKQNSQGGPLEAAWCIEGPDCPYIPYLHATYM